MFKKRSLQDGAVADGSGPQLRIDWGQAYELAALGLANQSMTIDNIHRRYEAWACFNETAARGEKAYYSRSDSLAVSIIRQKVSQIHALDSATHLGASPCLSSQINDSYDLAVLWDNNSATGGATGGVIDRGAVRKTCVIN